MSGWMIRKSYVIEIVIVQSPFQITVTLILSFELL